MSLRLIRYLFSYDTEKSKTGFNSHQERWLSNYLEHKLGTDDINTVCFYNLGQMCLHEDKMLLDKIFIDYDVRYREYKHPVYTILNPVSNPLYMYFDIKEDREQKRLVFTNKFTGKITTRPIGTKIILTMINELISETTIELPKVFKMYLPRLQRKTFKFKEGI